MSAKGQRGRRRHTPRENVRPVPSALDGFTGRRLPGGCDDCAAYRTLEQHAPGVYVLLVHHDDTCPDYRTMRARRNP
jgi:hypothetical protein